MGLRSFSRIFYSSNNCQCSTSHSAVRESCCLECFSKMQKYLPGVSKVSLFFKDKENDVDVDEGMISDYELEDEMSEEMVLKN